jgi:SAM-dependent methyltransferase
MFGCIVMLRRCLAHPLTRGLSIDSPQTTELRRQIIRGNRFLQQIYREWCGAISRRVPHVPGEVLELGSGGGILADYIPDAITSEVFPCSGIRMVADGRSLPLASGSLRAIVLVDVLHHIPEVRGFFREAARCLSPGGAVIMLEPWVSRWSRFVYTRFHHEPFQSESPDWSFPEQGPLSGANIALPWIVFERDRALFEAEFPELRIEQIQPLMPFRYLVSGGVSMRSLMPGAATPLWRALEKSLEPWMRHWAMFALIVLRRM